jgi:hypothetical protein
MGVPRGSEVFAFAGLTVCGPVLLQTARRLCCDSFAVVNGRMAIRCGRRRSTERSVPSSSQQRDLPASWQGRRDRPGDGDSARRCGRRSKLVQERASVCGVAWPCSQTAIKWRPRQTIRYQQTWRSLSAHVADPLRSLCAWAGSRQAGSEKPVARQDAAAATAQHRRCRARKQECADRLELAHQRQRL